MIRPGLSRCKVTGTWSSQGEASFSAIMLAAEGRREDGLYFSVLDRRHSLA
jgi:hypothetical protein